MCSTALGRYAPQASFGFWVESCKSLQSTFKKAIPFHEGRSVVSYWVFGWSTVLASTVLVVQQIRTGTRYQSLPACRFRAV